ncbi:hypothetical protein Ae201684_004906 [Aphanomyces euteiches]|uniref:Uncharacterized protein n=1 Tax=Aphanomyces euteiches TaxID=100861 RepID=A0A6G0XGG6_9STRA|nr:hypothetical protein Ae201684_004906 [Aphanomyces euteiches]
MPHTATYRSIETNDAQDQTCRHPIDDAGLLSKLFFEWATLLLCLGNERQLDPEDVWPLQTDNQCKSVGQRIEPTLEKTRSIIWSMAHVFGFDMIVIGILQVTRVVCDLYDPYVLQQIVVSMESTDGLDVTYCLELVGTLVVARVIAALLSAHSELNTQLVVVKTTSALQHLLFRKALRLGASSLGKKSTGEISNYFSADIRTIVSFSTLANQLWILPIQIMFTLGLLYSVIGWSTFVGAGVMALSLIANQWVSNGIQSSFGSMMEQRDKRMKTVNEIFSSIQIIKLNAWEEKFADKLSMERAQELKSVWNLFMWGSFNIVFFYLTPIMVTIASFASYTFVQNETLPASKLFTALSYLTMLKVPFSTLSYTVSTGLQALVSLRRIMEFLNLDEKKNVVVWTPATAPACKFEEYVNANIAVALEDASIGWDTEKPLFKNVNLTIKHGEFVVIHGSVGEGKSSLCAAFLGEMAKFSGNIFVGGRIAYFSQQTWIQNLTIRENILFGKPYDREKYNRVIQAWALTKDLSLFAADDRAEIGQKGINLSGGQKARVCLARACYSDADIFILDSPLSAVDAIVQNKIFTKCFLGLLRNKTILLVTHSPDIIGSKYLDRLVEVKDGQLAETIRHVLHETLLKKMPQVLDMVTSNNAGNSCSILISPSISTPQHAAETELFTPVVKSIGHRFGEVASGQLILDEERSEGHVSTQVYKNYLEFDGLATDLWLNLWTGIVYKVTPEEFLNESGYYLAVYALLSLCAAFATSKTLFDQMTNALPRAPMRFFDQNPHGRILNRYTNDIATIDMDIPLSSGFIILTTFSSVCTIATAIYMTNYLVVPILQYLYVALGRLSAKPLRDLERVSKVATSPLLNLDSEAIEGVLVIRSEEITTQWLRLRIQLISGAVLLVISVSLVMMHSQLTPGQMGLCLNYIFISMSMLEFLIPSYAQFETSMVGPERVLEYCKIEPEAPRVISGAVSKEWPANGDIQFTNMGFRYKDNDPLVLKDMNVHIESGEKIGIVGRTGAGKSSLTLALFRINELATGYIKIDGMDISKVCVKTLRSAIAIIPQTPVLFKGTLRNYLDPFSEFTDDELWSALQKVKLIDRISSVEGKLDSPVEENGENFSVGERQMLCMARALLRHARIVVMDEATAAIDHETDQNLQRVIRTEFASSTVLTIAHRLDTVLDSDRILVFDQGRLVQCDSPKSLIIQGSGIFFDLCSEGGYLDKMLELQE